MKMVMLLSVLVACTGLVVAQDGMGQKAAQEAETVKPCDMAHVEKAKMCKACMEIDPEVKEGKCACGGDLEEVEVCVKVYYTCDCGGMYAAEKECCGKKAAKETSKSPVIIACAKCGAPADAAGKCGMEGCDGEAKRTCADSGAWPHGGDEPK